MFLKISKYVAITLVGLLIALSGGVWYAQSHASQWAKKYVGEFGQSIGYLIDFNDLKITLRSPTVAIDGLKIVDLANQHQLLALQNIQISASWGGLISKKIEIDQISIHQAQVLAEKEPENWN